MKVVKYPTKDTVLLEITVDEAGVVNNAILEMLRANDESELSSRFGRSKEYFVELLDGFGDLFTSNIYPFRYFEKINQLFAESKLEKVRVEFLKDDRASVEYEKYQKVYDANVCSVYEVEDEKVIVFPRKVYMEDVKKLWADIGEFESDILDVLRADGDKDLARAQEANLCFGLFACIGVIANHLKDKKDIINFAARRLRMTCKLRDVKCVMMATLEVVAEAWTGWSRFQPKPKRYEIQVYPGKQLKIVKRLEKEVAYVKEVSEDSVTIVTSGLAPKREGAGIDLATDYSGHELVLQKGQSADLVTQTMDAGTTYTILLKDIYQFTD